ncbi:MAG: glutamate-5-semialdehyde dehydrogenase [Gemmataceae bacterium]
MTLSFNDYSREKATKAQRAAATLGMANSTQKNQWLLAAAEALHRHADRIMTANATDVAAAPEFGLSPSAIDRLRITPKVIDTMTTGLRQVAALPDPIGVVLEGGRRPNGLQVLKVGVPLGVLFFLYESRPNVTVDAAALCVKSGNAVILRGGKEARHSNQILTDILTGLLGDFGLPADAVQFIDRPEREIVGELLRMPELIDLVIPRGGESLIRRVMAEAQMPVLKHYRGNCHVYVHADAEAAMAEAIIVNAKCQRPGVCNALESILVDRACAEVVVPRLLAALMAKGVEVRGCSETQRWNPAVVPATDDDFREEYLALVVSMKIVDDLAAAIAHINTYGSKHSDAIITQNMTAAHQFTLAVDSAAVLVNASTRFHDGFELGLGAEIGISTDKLHARGPCALKELTTYKYIIHGSGQIRT